MKNTRKSLYLSALSLLLCVAMLVGSTFAWFTDSVTSGKNTIKAGNLDVNLQYKNGSTSTFTDVTATSNVFEENTLWEPGHVEYAVLKVENKGTLDLKYGLGIAVASETAGTNVAGQSFKLSDYLQSGVVDGDQSTLGRDAMVAAATNATTLSTPYYTNGAIKANADADVVTLVVWMPTTVENEANYKTGTAAPTILLGVNLNATQLASEKDSFDNTYDSATAWMGGKDDEGLADNTDSSAKTVKIESGEQLASFAAAVNGGNNYAGYTITLEKNLDLNNVAWTPIGNSANAFNGIFDGQEHTIKNLTASGTKYVGLFGNGFSAATIKNVKIDGATVSGVAYTAALAGKIYGTVDNCHVSNATVSVTGAFNGTVYEDGAKAAAIVGFLGEGTGEKITNCSATDVTVNGYRDLGGIAGCIYADNTVTGNTVTNVVINQGDYSKYESADYTTLGAIYGSARSRDTAGNLQANTGDATINAITIVPAAATAAETAVNVKNAIAAATEDTTIVLPEVEQTIDLSNTNLSKDGAVVEGNDKIEIKVSTGSDSPSVTADGLTFDGVTFDYGNGDHNGYNAIRGTVTYKNCTFKGVVNSYDTSTFENCTFTNTGDYYCAHVYGGTATFTGCTFNGDVKCVYVYTEGGDATATFEDCAFTFSLTTSDGEPDKSAVMLNANNGTGAYTVTITGCTQTGGNTTAAENVAGNTNYQGIYGLKHKDGNSNAKLVKGTVTVDGTAVYTNN